MKKLLTLAIVFSLALVLCKAGFAQEAAAVADQQPMTVESVVQDGEVVYGEADACGPVMPYGPRCRPFMRRSCMPCYANPCNPCPPCPPQNCAPMMPRRFRACPPVASCEPCGYPCADPCGYGGGYGGYGNDCGYGNACGYGSGYQRTPIRNFFARIFAPRPNCGYDMYYGPSGYGYGQGDCCW